MPSSRMIPDAMKTRNGMLAAEAGQGGNRSDPSSRLMETGWDATFIEHCKKLAAERLLGAASRLFREQTGCDLHVVWAPRGALGWHDPEPGFRTPCCPPEARSRLADGCCVEFDHKHLAGILAASAGTHGFVCPLDVRTVGCRIVAGGVLLGIAFFQSYEGQARPDGDSCRRSAAQIKRMRHLLAFVVHDAVETVLAEVGHEIIDRMREELESSQRIEVGLRETLHRMVPALDQDAAAPENRNHGDLIVRRMLDYVNTLYCSPIGLADFAERAGMNLSYLSHLFSKTMGMPFRVYLRQLRMDRARKLLSDPLRRISDVAYAVGYSDPNRFRLDFKSHTGLAPSRWRERFVSGE